MMIRPTLLVVLAASVLLSACDSNHRRVQVAVITAIPEPSNLDQSTACRTLWASLTRGGMEMDSFSPDWNDVVLDSAYALIQSGCVQSRASD